MSTTKVAVAAGVCILAAVAYVTFKPTKPQSEPPVVEAEPAAVIATADPAPVEPVAPEPIEVGPPDVLFVADDDLEPTVTCTFDEKDKDLVWSVNTDPGLLWTIEDGEGRFAGTTADAAWRQNHFEFPVYIDGIRAKLEVSGDFRIARQDGYHLVALWAPTPPAGSRLCMFYQSQGGAAGDGIYTVQTRWMNMNTRLSEGSGTIPAFGNEADVFHKMRMVLDRTARTITYYVDDTLIGVVSYEGEIAPIGSVGMDIETPNQGTTLDIRYDNMRVRGFGPIYPSPDEN